MNKFLHKWASDLFPINRSITGKGVRDTLAYIKDIIPNLNIISVPSGKKVFDWVVPNEWDISEAYIEDRNGNRIIDVANNNLHVVGNSESVDKWIDIDVLNNFLHSIPEQPTAIPYVTSYYNQTWGFCLSENQRSNLKDQKYHVVIESKLNKGFLNYGELIIPGKSKKEIFLSTYICHPSMANNELSGPTVTTYLAKWLKELPNRYYTYRFIFIPETIGSITYLSNNLKHLKNKVVAGYNVSCVGDDRSYSYLPSRNGNTISDKVAKHVLKYIAPNYKSYSWLDRGSDERQYCAPGIDLPIASILRTKYGEYPEYHTSLDNLKNVVTPKGLDGGYWALRKALELLEKNKTYKYNIFCEPQLVKRGFYLGVSSKKSEAELRVIKNFLSFCDGEHTLLDIAEKINLPAWELYEFAEKLLSQKLISEI